MKSRQLHLKHLFHPDYADMGLYVRAFIDQVRNTPLFDNLMVSHVKKPWDYEDKWADKEHQDYPAIKDILNAFQERYPEESFEISGNTYYALRASDSCNNQLNVDVLTILVEINNYLFNAEIDANTTPYTPCGDDLRGCLMYLKDDTDDEFQKLSDKDYVSRVRDIFYEKMGASFISSPGIILREGLSTLIMSFRWLCMHILDPNEMIPQMRAAFEPTIQHPRSGKMISPIEMLGYGDNGDNGVLINKHKPSSINGELIIRNATQDDPSIVHPDFARIWLDRDLEIGGCPALVHQRLIGDIYMDFARLYVDMAEKVKEYKDKIPNQPTHKPCSGLSNG